MSGAFFELHTTLSLIAAAAAHGTPRSIKAAGEALASLAAEGRLDNHPYLDELAPIQRVNAIAELAIVADRQTRKLRATIKLIKISARNSLADREGAQWSRPTWDNDD